MFTVFNINTMAQKLYVGGLPYSTTDQELADAFAQAGTVTSASIVTDRMTGRSRGFGFVEMSSEAEGTAAIDMWHGKEFGGRTLTVNVARPKEDRPAGGGGDRRGGNGGGWRDR
jgi:RNA recognition motif-containing protein